MRYGTGVALCLAAGSLWSLMGLGLRQIEDASVWAILFWRSAGMVPVLLGFIWWNSGGRPIVSVRAVGLAGVWGGVSLVLAFSGAIYALQTTTVANAVLLFSASPFVAAVLGWVFLREKVQSATWAAIGLAAFGMYLMVRDGLAIGALEGNLAALLSAVGFGAFTVALRWGRVADMLPAAMLGAIFATLFAGVILLVRGESLLVSTHDMGLAAAMGAGIVALGLVMYTIGSKVVPAAELTLLSLIEVLLAPFWVWLVVGETVSRATLIGGSVLLTAVLLNAFASASARKAVVGQFEISF
jgi:drug/metabolite transporter, DME family